MSIARRITAPSTIKHRVQLIVCLLAAISLAVALLAYLQVEIISAVRAYVHAESLWAKAQKNAVLELRACIAEPTTSCQARFEQTLRPILAYRDARLAMQQHQPDWQAARAGFLGGGSHPDDVDNMIRLFLWGGNISYMHDAIEIWQQGDKGIMQLQALAAGIHTRASIDRSGITADVLALDRLSDNLNVLEIAFSEGLGEGARWTERTVNIANLVLLVLMLLAAGRFTRKILADIDSTELRLRESEARFRSLYDTDMIGVITWGVAGDIHDANDAFLRLLGYTRNDLETGKLNWMALTPEQYRSDSERAMQQIQAQGYCIPFEKALRHRDGYHVPVLAGGALMHNSKSTGTAFLLDRREQKRMEQELRLAAIVLHAGLDGILICDRALRVLKANDAYCNMFGCTQAQVMHSAALFCLHETPEEEARITAALSANGNWEGDTLVAAQGGEHMPVRISLSVVKSETGEGEYVVALFTDIRMRKALENSLKNKAYFDPLTKLPNRALLFDRMETALVRARRQRTHVAVLFLDLDKFKPVNDTLGHAVGDQVLFQIARRLESVIRESDTVARLGGDEFITVIESPDAIHSVTRIAETIIDTLALPLVINGITLQIGCSIGISLFPDHGESVVDLVRAADAAMYDAKRQKDKRWHVFQPPIAS